MPYCKILHLRKKGDFFSAHSFRPESSEGERQDFRLCIPLMQALHATPCTPTLVSIRPTTIHLLPEGISFCPTRLQSLQGNFATLTSGSARCVSHIIRV